MYSRSHVIHFQKDDKRRVSVKKSARSVLIHVEEVGGVLFAVSPW